jgi:dimeric dUTPase (all-alpha-NTP-PPase superfamily)
MLVKTLFSRQKELDDYILENCNARSGNHQLNHQDLVTERLLALFVEVGEFISAPMSKKLEEYVDCLHFILSLRFSLDMQVYEDHEEFEELYTRFLSIKSEEQTAAMLITSISYLANSTRCFKYWSTQQCPSNRPLVKELYYRVFRDFLRLGNAAGFAGHEVVEAYDKKYQENIRRQQTGY